MLELEAMGIDRVKVGLAAQYVDHNLVQNDHLNADEHLFLRSACRRFGVWYSRPGNGISHPVHMQRFGKPGRHWSVPTVIRRRRARSACSHLAPAVSRLR